MGKIYTLFLLFFATFAFSQTNTGPISIDDRLTEVFDLEYLNTLQDQSPTTIIRWNFYLDNSWYITELPEKKEVSDLPEVIISDLGKLNILLLEKEQGLTRDWTKRIKYKIKNTNKVLVYYSGKEFNRTLNQHLGRT